MWGDGRLVRVRNESVLGSPMGSVGAGAPVSTSFTHTSAPATPSGLPRRVGEPSSTRRSWCVRRVPGSTLTSGRVVGVGDGVREVSRTVIPIVARSASVVLVYPCTKLVMGRTFKARRGSVVPRAGL